MNAAPRMACARAASRRDEHLRELVATRTRDAAVVAHRAELDDVSHAGREVPRVVPRRVRLADAPELRDRHSQLRLHARGGVLPEPALQSAERRGVAQGPQRARHGDAHGRVPVAERGLERLTRPVGPGVSEHQGGAHADPKVARVGELAHRRAGVLRLGNAGGRARERCADEDAAQHKPKRP